MLFNSDKSFTGKHKDMIFFLCKDRGMERKDGINLFDRVADLYILAPIVGLIYNRREKPDPGDKSTILYATIESIRDKLIYDYRLVMLLANKDELTEEERLNRAFRYDNDDEKTKKNMQIFDEYTLGGIEVIFEKFEDSHSREDILQNLFEFLDLESDDE